ncbi:MAG: HAMP domain-containing protein [Anaerolineae bacterium]|nr:HAMP domain-containing protein [Anaerolineae bacterium]
MATTRRHSLRSLRWKLTLSYTLVTVSVLLTVAALIAPFLFNYALAPTALLAPEPLIEAVREGYLPQARTILLRAAAAPRSGDETLAQVFVDDLSRVTVSEVPLLRVGEARLSIQIDARFSAVLVDAEGRILGITGVDAALSEVLGQSFAATGALLEAAPEAVAPLAAALSGEQNPARLSAIRETDGALIVAVPVTGAAAGRSEEILGALALLVESLPTQQDAPVYTLRTLGVSLLLFVLIAGVLGTIFGAWTARGWVRRFRALAAATDAWSRGEFSVLIADNARDELGRLARQMNRMAAQLHAQLEQGQELAVLQERNRLARDLHDSAKQRALAAAAQLGAAALWLERDPEEARSHLDEARQLVDEVRRELQDLIYQLRPAELETQGLDEALRRYVDNWSRRSGIAVVVRIENVGPAPLQVAQALFRIAQESLSNVARHSRASRVAVSLAADPSGVALTISDDGQGFDVAGPPGLGLRSIRERIEALGGTVTISSEIGNGTTIAATWRPPPVAA